VQPRRRRAPGQRFTRATVEVSVTVPAVILEAVVPPWELATPPVTLIALVRCEPSRHRRSVVLAATVPAAGLVCRGRVELAREELLGAAELSILLVRDAASPDAGQGWATERGARLASARSWEVRVDVGASPRGEYLDVREEDFAKIGPPQFRQPDAVYQLDCEGESVVLWLNSARTRVVGVLHSEGNVGRRARLRDAVFDRIYAAVWMRLFLRAAQDVLRLGEPAWPWQGAVLQKWLPELYPDQPDHEARLDALHLEAADGLHDLLGRLDLAIQAENQAAHLYEMLIEEVEP
jgi:hypothetical protein